MVVTPRNILVAQTIYLGDLILTLPLVNALQAAFPKARICLLVNKGLGELAGAHPYVSCAREFDKSGYHAGAAGLRRLVRELRSEQFDAAIVLPGSIRTALAVMLARIPHRIGWDPGSDLSRQLHKVRFPDAMQELPFVKGILRFERLYRAGGPLSATLLPLFTTTLEFAEGEHVAMRALRALQVLDAPVPEALQHPWLPLPDTVRAVIASRFPAPANGRAIIAPAATLATRRWPITHFAKIAQLLASDGLAVTVIGSDTDRGMCEQLVREANSPLVESAAGLLSPLESLCLINQSSIVVANDSAPVHMASAMGTPTVALFGPTTTAFGFGPLAPRSRVMERGGLSCRPCTIYGGSRCPIGSHECLEAIQPGDVHAVIRDILATGS
jgi:heptosyltransferase II